MRPVESIAFGRIDSCRANSKRVLLKLEGGQEVELQTAEAKAIKALVSEERARFKDGLEQQSAPPGSFTPMFVAPVEEQDSEEQTEGVAKDQEEEVELGADEPGSRGEETPAAAQELPSPQPEVQEPPSPPTAPAEVSASSDDDEEESAKDDEANVADAGDGDKEPDAPKPAEPTAEDDDDSMEAGEEAEGATRQDDEGQDDDEEEDDDEEDREDEGDEEAVKINPASSWVSFQDDDGDEFYFNRLTEQSSWDPPPEGIAAREDGNPYDDASPRAADSGEEEDASPLAVPNASEEEEERVLGDSDSDDAVSDGDGSQVKDDADDESEKEGSSDDEQLPDYASSSDDDGAAGSRGNSVSSGEDYKDFNSDSDDPDEV